MNRAQAIIRAVATIAEDFLFFITGTGSALYLFGLIQLERPWLVLGGYMFLVIMGKLDKIHGLLRSRSTDGGRT